MEKSTKHTSKLNDLQVGLLRLFQREMTDEQIVSLKRVLVKHYQEMLHSEINQVVIEKGYTQTDFDRMLNQKS